MATLIEERTESAVTWSNRPFVSDGLRRKVASADILLVPDEGYVDRPDLRFFPSGTTEFVEYLRRETPPNVLVEACIDDDDYREVTRHAAILYVAKAVVTLLAAPLFVNLLAQYIKRKLASLKDPATLKTSVTFHDRETGRSVHLSYEGPATEFRNTALGTLKEMQRPSRPVLTPPRNDGRDRGDTDTPPKLPSKS